MVGEYDCIRSRRELKRMTVAHCAVLSVHIYLSDGLRMEGVALIYRDRGGSAGVDLKGAIGSARETGVAVIFPELRLISCVNQAVFQRIRRICPAEYVAFGWCPGLRLIRIQDNRDCFGDS
jgi:hypothetical protein